MIGSARNVSSEKSSSTLSTSAPGNVGKGLVTSLSTLGPQVRALTRGPAGARGSHSQAWRRCLETSRLASRWTVLWPGWIGTSLHHSKFWCRTVPIGRRKEAGGQLQHRALAAAVRTDDAGLSGGEMGEPSSAKPT